MARAVILGTGCGAPDRVVTNKDLEAIMDTSDEWITQRTGIKERHWAVEGEKWSDFMAPACQRALDDAGVAADELDMIIAGTNSGDTLLPNAGCTLQSLLGAKKAAALEVGAACSGFILGLTIADRFIRLDPSLKVLVAGGELISQRIDPEDRSVSVLFGDGGGAVVLTGSEENDGRGILASRYYSDGDLGDLLYITHGGTEHPITADKKPADVAIQMRGNEIFKVAVKGMIQASKEVLEEAGCDASEVDIVIPHQANLRIIQMVAKQFKIPMEKVFINIHKYGNTSAGTVPLALHEAVQEGRINKGDLVLMPVFGGGLTWGATLVRW